MVHITSISKDMGISAACVEELATSCSLHNRLLANIETGQDDQQAHASWLTLGLVLQVVQVRCSPHQELLMALVLLW